MASVEYAIEQLVTCHLGTVVQSCNACWSVVCWIEMSCGYYGRSEPRSSPSGGNRTIFCWVIKHNRVTSTSLCSDMFNASLRIQNHAQTHRDNPESCIVKNLNKTNIVLRPLIVSKIYHEVGPWYQWISQLQCQQSPVSALTTRNDHVKNTRDQQHHFQKDNLEH